MCGAAASTEVAEPRGWRVPLALGGALVLLAIVGVVLALVALSGGSDKVAQVTPSPTAALPTTTPAPSATFTPSATPSTGTEQEATPTATPGATESPTPSPTTGGGTTTTGSFSGWPGGTGWTVVLESSSTQSKAESVAQDLQSKGDTVGILKSDDFSSLNPGYWVVFSQKYDSKKAAEDAMDSLASKPRDAYVRHVVPA